jgi:alpha-glucosidase (family GH31 glycosyl hydrolase)
MQVKASIKHIQINKANNAMFITVAVASVVTVFSLFSAKALLAQSAYQHKVLKNRNEAIKTLKSNVQAANSLKKQYDNFESQNPNIIGGVGGDDIAEAITKSGGSGSVSLGDKTVALNNQDGDNAKIVLDALPSAYDFPALISSIEKIAHIDNIPLESVGGTDDSGNPSGTSGTTSTTTTQGQNPNPGAGTSSAVAIPFNLSSQTNYVTTQALIKDLERSIRPVDITRIGLQGNGASMNVDISANTYYQAPVGLQITQKGIK